MNHEFNGRKFTEVELLGLLWSAAAGAVDTTKHAIGHVTHLLGTDPDLRRRLIADPSLIPAAVNESLRLNPSAYMTARTVEQPVTLGGIEMKPGERVLMVFGWGNRDESVFEDPDRPVLERRHSRHLTFGHGAHQCAGQHLARLEICIAVEELLSRLPDYALEEPEQKPLLHGGMMWAHDELPIQATG